MGPACASRSSTSATSAISSAACSEVRRQAFAAGRQPSRGNDLETHVRISFEDSLKGVQVRVPVEVETACTVCHGTGAEPGNRADHVSRSARVGRGLRLAGPLRVLAAVPALSWQRHRSSRSPCKTLPRQRARARHEALPGEDPGRSEGRHSRSASRARARPGHNGGPAGDLFVVVEVDAVAAVRAPRGRPPARRAGDLPGGGARRDGPDPDSRRPGRAQGAGRHREREAPPRQGPRRAEAQRQWASGDLLARVKVTVPRSSRSREGSARELPEGAREPREAFS